MTVPVTREEVRVEREPITDANVGDALDGPAISEEEHEVVLHEERPVVATEAVPVERVRMGTQTVTDQEKVPARSARSSSTSRATSTSAASAPTPGATDLVPPRSAGRPAPTAGRPPHPVPRPP